MYKNPIFYLVVAFVVLLILSASLFLLKTSSFTNDKLISQSNIYSDLSELIGTVKFLGYEDLSIPEKGKFILADLNNMTITLYQDKKFFQQFKIASIGREGKPWETPRGEFSITEKKLNHMSSITGVWMPYSLPFLGNYFIHGWPYYQDGTPVPDGFSGGCIRLATEDAREVFNFAEAGTKLFVVDDLPNINMRSWHYYPIDATLLPEVSAEAYLVADLDTGAVIARKNADKVYPIASLVKLMTALVALDQINPIGKIKITVPSKDIPYGHVGGLVIGEEILASDLLWPLLLESSNHSAFILGYRVGLNNFVNQMNKRAISLKLTKTSFVDPAGIGDGNVSTAEDLFKLVRHIFFEKIYIFSITRERELKSGNHRWKNNNPFVSREDFLGGKSGQTNLAKQSFVNIFEHYFDNTRRRIVIIVLRSEDRDGDTLKLLQYVGNNIKLVQNR